MAVEAGGRSASAKHAGRLLSSERRSLALAIFFLSAAAGDVLGLIIGSYIADVHDWRWAFIAFGLPGFLLVLLTTFILAEPRTLPGYQVRLEDGKNLQDALQALVCKSSCVNAVVDMLLHFAMIYGALTFSVLFLIRTQGTTLAETTAYYGGIALISALIDSPLLWMARGSACKTQHSLDGAHIRIRFLLTLPLFVGSYLSNSLSGILALLSLGLGSIIVGVLSDGFAASYGPVEGLR